MGLPTINIEFKKLAQTAIMRSERGILAIIVQDGTKDFTSKTYGAAAEVDSADYTADNYAAIMRAFDAGVYQVVVIRLATSAAATTIAGALEGVSFNWVCAVSNKTGFQDGLATAVKNLNRQDRRIRKAKALVFGVEAPDDMHVVNVANTTVTLKGQTSALAMHLYLPRLAGILAACPMTEAVTYKELGDLDDIAEVSGLDTAIDAGKLCLFKDDDTIRIARGVNSLTTTSTDVTEDMKKITVVEGMDMIQEDIARSFKANYQGKVKNNANNQALFVAEVFAYFRELVKETIIDMSETDTVEIDIDAMRVAWANAGTSVADLTDAQVKKNTFRSSVFVKASCTVLDAMEDLKMTVSLG